MNGLHLATVQKSVVQMVYIRERTRACDSPTQEGTGADCVGDKKESESCNVLLVN